MNTAVAIEDMIHDLTSPTMEEFAALLTEQLPNSLRGLEIVDLGAIDPSFDFESAGLHKRARAGLGALLRRSMDHVTFGFDTPSCTEGREPGYADYDRVLDAVLSTFASDSMWSNFHGSQRGCVIRMLDAYHVAGSRTVEEGTWYARRGFIAVVTDAEGIPSVVVRLCFVGGDLHPEVTRLWDALAARVRAQALEELIREPRDA